MLVRSRRPLGLRIPLAALSLLAAALGGGCSDEDPPPPVTNPNLGDVDEIMLSLPKSCAFACAPDCTEPAEPFACPTLKPWNELPHAAACEAWDGTYPAPAAGQCTVTDATGEAAAKAGPLPGGGFVLPDGHRIRPVGREEEFDEAGLEGGFPMSIVAVPSTRLALVSDGGIRDNALRVLDLDALAGAGEPVASTVAFPRPSSLYYGLAWLPPDRALASGGGDAKIYAFDVAPGTGAATRAEARDIDLGTSGENPWYAGAIAATGDGTRLLVGPSQWAKEIQVISLETANYGTKLATISTGSYALFDLKRDPFDPGGTTFYATDQAGSRLLEIDAAAGKVLRTIALAKSPAQMVFLDATYMVVAEAHGDSIAIVNRATGNVDARVPVFEADAPRGFSPSALAYDAQNGRLYATLAGVNAVEVYDVAAGTPPTVTPVGRLSTGWWPTGVMVDTDGSLVVISGKGHGTGPDETPYEFGEGAITDRMAGSVQHVPAAEFSNLDAHTKAVEAGRRLWELPGHPAITCPAGADDFPIPADNESGPSKAIKHVILIIRENKTYDAIFGDRPDLGDGDPKLIMAGNVELQSKVWQNARAIAGTFTNFDNFYTDAEQSLQGHTWTAFGRTNDYVERIWLSTWGRGTRPPTEPVITEASNPEEGTIFEWLHANGVDYDNMGEIGGTGPNGLDGKYPGLVYSGNLPDTDKSCYIAGRIRLLCDLKPFTYALQPNDHTNGGLAGSAAPEVMIAVNDEATGMLLDALSHSPRWKDTLLIVTEDDPQDGGDHVDLHRTLLLMASPWVRRGYVSHGHYDMGSVYKLIAHIYGIPYNNESIRSALLPLDAFTSTPDYTPFRYQPRTVDAPCNGSNTKEAKEAEAWDFSEPDEQPGLSEQIARMMRTSAEARGVKIVATNKPAVAR
ncbi:alkaline phosphatase family protein [Polyangium aurulentum]|uniref:alkaline phosphatase family protein n=1 Tax=Polyangium aurulentum TaxID=2567896 RepID=UPI0010AEE96D|nr:alkaline phosphatase family protein [Polyangium aurulentum]UQA62859.1 hypothetical protein E8A73_021355 [Polyangium aurulentum]